MISLKPISQGEEGNQFVREERAFSHEPRGGITAQCGLGTGMILRVIFFIFYTCLSLSPLPISSTALFRSVSCPAAISLETFPRVAGTGDPTEQLGFVEFDVLTQDYDGMDTLVVSGLLKNTPNARSVEDDRGMLGLIKQDIEGFIAAYPDQLNADILLRRAKTIETGSTRTLVDNHKELSDFITKIFNWLESTSGFPARDAHKQMMDKLLILVGLDIMKIEILEAIINNENGYVEYCKRYNFLNNLRMFYSDCKEGTFRRSWEDQIIDHAVLISDLYNWGGEIPIELLNNIQDRLDNQELFAFLHLPSPSSSSS